MKIDYAKVIEGYADMTPEQKLEAIEAYEIDMSGYVTKTQFDKTASELATKKKELNSHLSEEEKKQKERDEQFQALQTERDTLLREKTVSQYVAKFVGMGYETELANETAEAMVDGNTDKVFENQMKFNAAQEQKFKADVLKGTPRPVGSGGSDVMTLETFRALSGKERAEFYQKHPEEYAEMYKGE